LAIRKSAKAEEVQRTLGDRIRQLRSSQGWSQEQFAGVCGLHRTYMGHVERGEKNVSLSTVVRISDALGLRLPELFAAGKSAGAPAKGRPRKMKNLRGAAPAGLFDSTRLLNELRSQRKALKEAVGELTRLGGKLGVQVRRMLSYSHP
jgi:transcriptional regulator with XRE-family HTH domain